MLEIAERVVSEGAEREGKVAADLGPDDARGLLEAWLVERSACAPSRGC